MESKILTPRLRWMSADPDKTAHPVGARLTSTLKKGVDGEAEGIPAYAWLTEKDERYKAISLANIGDVVPTVEKIFSMFEMSDLLQVSVPDEELVDFILDGAVVPSVTSIPSFLIRADGLNRWKMGQKLDRLMEITDGVLPVGDGESWSQLKSDVINYDDPFYADRGSRWHTAIEQTIKGIEVTSLLPVDYEAFSIAISQIMAVVEGQQNADLERSFVHPDGYGGTVDYRASRLVIDWKTKEKRLTTKKGTLLSTIPQIENPIQLAAYAKGLGIDNPRLCNCYINVLTGEVIFHEYARPDLALIAWDTLLMFWKTMIDTRLKHGTPLTEI